MTDNTTVLDALRTVHDPVIENDIVSLGLIESVSTAGDSVDITVVLPTPGDDAEGRILTSMHETLTQESIEANISTDDSPWMSAEDSILPGVKHVIAVASGKGGVGKTTVAANLARRLADRGCSVGILDADIHGPNLPRLLAVEGPPAVTGEDALAPPMASGIKVMSMAFLTRNHDDPAILRGPMVNKVMMHFLENVAWGELDYLVVDLPPGTGDASLDLLQTLPVSGTVIVTTPHQLAVDDARKGLNLFATHEAPILGVVENMSYFECHGCGEDHSPFGTGGAQEICAAYDVPYLGSLPIHEALGGDDPIVGDGATSANAAMDAVVASTLTSLGEVNRRRVARQQIADEHTPTVSMSEQ